MDSIMHRFFTHRFHSFHDLRHFRHLRPGALGLRLAFALLLSGLYGPGRAPLAAAASSNGGVLASAVIKPGVEVLCDEYAAALAGKRVGILTNPTGVDRALVSTIDRVRALPGVRVVRLFAPEHGLRGAFAAGAQVDENRDPVSGLPIVSLYGASRRPSPAALKDLDVVLYDTQDVGHRTYTFVSSLTYLIDACEKAGVEVWVLDRPEPAGGDKVGGPMLDEANKSFIGVMNVPQEYGLTPGEWARLVQAERTPRLKLRVIPLRGWRRGMTYGELGWLWVPPSEHVPRWETSLFYAMTGTLGELQVVSEGVGTPLPFEQVGAPWLDGVAFEQALNARRLPGVRFRATSFRPRYGTHAGSVCQGVQIHLTDPHACQPARVSAAILQTLATMYRSRHLFAPTRSEGYQMFLNALGDSAYARALAAGGPFDSVEEKMAAQHERYAQRREKVLIYQ
jgi:uncharacterized protein YbbC (DUF1343 family)